MFRQIAGSIPGGADALFQLHPVQLAALLEQAWELRVHNPALPTGHPDHRSDLPGLPGLAGGAGLGPFLAANPALARQVRGDHLIYAYMIENTYIFEAFEQLLRDLLHGDDAGNTSIASATWLRNTEELFFSEPAPFSITRVFSQLRPDLRATRRYAYNAMFNLDLNHGVGDKKEYPYRKSKVSNTAFVATFEDLLREVWVGISNLGNASGVDPTDTAAISNLTSRLHDMLIARREGGSLSREEFYAVSTMAWFHLTVEYDSPILVAIGAQGTSPDERLIKVAERAKSRVHARARSFFELADPMSVVLIEIEKGTLTAAPRTYFDSTIPGNILPGLMNTIITHWSNVTGHDMKTRRTLVTA